MLRRQKIRRVSSFRGVKSTGNTGSFLGKFFFLLSLIGLMYLLFFSEVFVLKSIKTDGPNTDGGILNSKIIQTISDARGKNLIFLNTRNLEIRLEKSFPDFEKIIIVKSFPSSLKVSFSKYPDSANVVYENASGKTVYIINSIGMLVKSDAEKPNLPFIKLHRDEPINVDEVLIEKTKLDYILEVSKYFEDKFGMRVKELIYKPYARELHLVTERNFSIWLDIQKDFDGQLKKLKKVASNLDIYNENLEYIDLRIAGSSGDRIIYKRR